MGTGVDQGMAASLRFVFLSFNQLFHWNWFLQQGLEVGFKLCGSGYFISSQKFPMEGKSRGVRRFNPPVPCLIRLNRFIKTFWLEQQHL